MALLINLQVKSFLISRNKKNNFLSNKNNLTLLQCLLYGVLGYLLKEHYSWGEFIIVFIICFIAMIFDVDDVDPQVMKEVKRIMNERNDKD